MPTSLASSSSRPSLSHSNTSTISDLDHKSLCGSSSSDIFPTAPPLARTRESAQSAQPSWLGSGVSMPVTSSSSSTPPRASTYDATTPSSPAAKDDVKDQSPRVSVSSLPLPARTRSGIDIDGNPVSDSTLNKQVRAAVVDQAPQKPTLVNTPGRTPLIHELDPGTDPLQWSDRFKAWATATYCIMILSTTYASSAFAPDVNQMRAEYGVGRYPALAGTSTYVLGFALGPFLMAPMSETFGRKPVYVWAFIGLTVANVIAAVAPNAPVFLVFRFLGGFCGSSALNNVAASISDMTHIRNRLRPNTAYRLVSFGGPTLGPFAGTWITQRVSWRWNMRTLPMLSFVALCLYAFTIPESHRATLERKQKHKRVKALRKLVEQVGDDVEKSAPQHRQAVEDFAALEQHESRHSGPTLGQRMITSLQRPFVFLCTEPLIIVVCIYTAVLYGLLYGLLAGVRFAFIRVNGFSDLQTSWVYLAILLGFTIGAAFIGSWLQDKQFKAAWDAGTYKPETRIGPAAWGSFAVPVGLFIFAWSAPYYHSGVHWIVPCMGMTIFAFGMQLTFNSWLSYLSDAYGENSASAMAAATFTRSLLGAAFPLFMADLLGAISVQWGLTIFAIISIPLSICGVLFVKHGHRIRARSRFAVHPTS